MPVGENVSMRGIEFQIVEDSSKAVASLEKLEAALERLRQTNSKTSSSLTKIQKKLNALNSTGVNAISKEVNKYSTAANLATNSTTAWGSSLKALNIGVLYYGLRRVTNVLGGFVKKSNDYQEDLNLFTVSMGKYAEQAQEYSDTVADVMGIDPSTWMRNQGVFNTLLTGFGNASDRAALMSENLTQLGYDLSSFFNISVEDAMTKIQSGISGELEPLRRLGYDLSQARLAATALELGIDKSISSMTQAEKAELRYYAVMTQVTTAQGDLARTLDAPANQLRVFSAQVQQLARSLGNILIPALNATLPYFIALVKVARMAADSIASLFGFELTEIDYSSVNGLASGAGSAADSLNDATTAAKKLKNATTGIDELNIISPDTGSGSAGGVGVGGGEFDFELPTYDFLGDATSDRIDKITEKLKALEPYIKAVAGYLATIAAIKIGTNVWGWLKTVPGNMKTAAVQAGLFVGSLVLLNEGIKDIGENGLTASNTFTVLVGGLGALVTGINLVTAAAAINPIFGGFAAAGLVVAAVAAISDAIHTVNQDTYEYSENCKIMNDIIERNSEISARSADGINSLRSAIADVNTASADWTAASTLVDEIYNINENANASAYELELMQVKIDTLNSMGLGDIVGQVDSVTGRLTKSREEAQGLLEDLQNTAKMSAMQDLLTEAYKTQAQALIDLERTNNDMKAAQEALSKTEAELAEVRVGDYATLSRLREQQKKQTEALNEATAAHGLTLEAYIESTQAIETYSGSLVDLQTALNDTTNDAENLSSVIGDEAPAAVKEFNTQLGYEMPNLRQSAYNMGANTVEGFNEGLDATMASTSAKVGSWCAGINSTMRSVMMIRSPSRVTKEFAHYYVQGFNNEIDRFGKSTFDVVKEWANGASEVMVVSFDEKMLQMYSPKPYYGEIAGEMSAAYSADISADGASEALAAFYQEYLAPVMREIADDTKRQADKDESPVFAVNGKVLTDTVNKQNRTNGYSFT